MSLLKRIEQGQGTSSNKKAPGGQGSDSSSSRLSSLQARRANAPDTTPQSGTYYDFACGPHRCSILVKTCSRGEQTFQPSLDIFFR